MTTPPVDEFEETTEVPAGRKARTLSESLAAKLDEAAKRGVAFSRTGSPDVIDELRKDLGSAAVKAKYVVTTATAQLENGMHKLTFSAKHKAAKTGKAAK